MFSHLKGGFRIFADQTVHWSRFCGQARCFQEGDSDNVNIVNINDMVVSPA